MKTKIFFAALLLLLVTGCQEQTDVIKKGSVKISILYPYAEGKTFDMEYYTNKHMPMVAELFGEPLIRYDIEKGIAGRNPDEPLSYVAIGSFYFDTLESYKEAFGRNAERILNDIPNYTDIEPAVQISAVIK